MVVLHLVRTCLCACGLIQTVWSFVMCFCSCYAFRVTGGRRSQQDQLVELRLSAPTHGQPSHSGKHWQTAAHIKVYYVGQSERPHTDCNRCFFYVAILSQCLTQYAHLHRHARGHSSHPHQRRPNEQTAISGPCFVVDLLTFWADRKVASIKQQVSVVTRELSLVLQTGVGLLDRIYFPSNMRTSSLSHTHTQPRDLIENQIRIRMESLLSCIRVLWCCKPPDA